MISLPCAAIVVCVNTEQVRHRGGAAANDNVKGHS